MTVTKVDLFEALASTQIPYTADTWWPDAAPPLPYVVAVSVSPRTFKTDGKVSFRTTSYRLEMYSHGRDRGTESAITAALDSAGIPYDVMLLGIIDQTDVYETIITVTVMGD